MTIAPGPEIDLGIAGIGPARLVGRGGFASVYCADQEGMGRKVAVKVIDHGVPSGSHEAQRFERERRALGALSDHPNIVSVFDWGLLGDGRPYLVMEYLPSGSLAARLAASGPLPAAEVVAVGLGIAGALAAAHERGILHRDLKPENILVSSFGHPVLCDFGIARLVDASRTATAAGMALSVAHAPPEIINGLDATPASDVWSLASTLWTLVAGSAPFAAPGDQLATVIARIMSGSPVGLDQVPEQLRGCLLAALERDPEVRLATAAELAAALAEAPRSVASTAGQVLDPSGVTRVISRPRSPAGEPTTIIRGAAGQALGGVGRQSHFLAALAQCIDELTDAERDLCPMLVHDLPEILDDTSQPIYLAAITSPFYGLLVVDGEGLTLLPAEPTPAHPDGQFLPHGLIKKAEYWSDYSVLVHGRRRGNKMPIDLLEDCANDLAGILNLFTGRPDTDFQTARALTEDD